MPRVKRLGARGYRQFASCLFRRTGHSSPLLRRLQDAGPDPPCFSHARPVCGRDPCGERALAAPCARADVTKRAGLARGSMCSRPSGHAGRCPPARLTGQFPESSLLRPLRLAVPPKAEYLLLWVAPDLLKLGQISTNLHSHLSSICKLRTGSGRGTSRTWSQGAKLRLLSPLRGHRA